MIILHEEQAAPIMSQTRWIYNHLESISKTLKTENLNIFHV
ncbi:hypothetical protein LINPERPRIM_LOCUS12430 [Linum perenne]